MDIYSYNNMRTSQDKQKFMWVSGEKSNWKREMPLFFFSAALLVAFLVGFASLPLRVNEASTRKVLRALKVTTRLWFPPFSVSLLKHHFRYTRTYLLLWQKVRLFLFNSPWRPCWSLHKQRLFWLWTDGERELRLGYRRPSVIILGSQKNYV